MPSVVSRAPVTPLRPWTDPAITGINRLPARSTYLPYATSDDARAGAGARTLSLDGDWSFKLLARPEDTPATFPDSGFDVSGWDTVTVPGVWTMQGHGRPQYTNVQMPFRPNRPPQVPDANPTGLYRTTFERPRQWDTSRVVLHLGAATSVATVWVNGRFVGVAKDSRLPSEFDLTDVLGEGPNTLAVQVVQWSDASYVEDQDQWWHAGLQRSVSLYATPATYLADLAVRSDYDHETRVGSLAVTVDVGELPGPGWSVVAALHDAHGRRALAADLVQEPRLRGGDHPGLGQAVLQAQLRGVRPWSAEEPTLYTLSVSLYDPVGGEVEATRTRVGFRTVAVRDRQLLVNGRPVVIKGVNRHEHHDRFGSAVPRETVLEDVRVLKAHNVNAVRTSHYPPDPYFLELADAYGLYVIDEADIEAHANYATLCDDPAYLTAFVDRVSRMVLRDRNHPSVIAWSLGNESGYGANHDAAAAWVRRVDPSRPLHYEGAIAGDWSGGHHATDLVCPMYPSIDAIVEWAKTTDDHRPLIMCEYAHAMGNSCGNLADYWEAIRSHHGLQGGFIWEMLDHGIAQTTPEGRPYWAYGGDFGEEYHDGNFVCDGLFWPDRRPHPAMAEVKYLFQPFAAEFADGGLRVENRHDFRDLSHVRVDWRVEVDGRVGSAGQLGPLTTEAGGSEIIAVPWSSPKLGPGEEAYAVLRFSTATDEPLLGVGHELGWVQLPLGVGSKPSAADGQPVSGTAPTVAERDDSWVVGGERHELVVRRTDGAVMSWQVDGVGLLEAGPAPTAWRAPTDNDGIRLIQLNHTSHQALHRWREAGLDDLADDVSSVELADDAGRRVIRRVGRLVPASRPDRPAVGYTLDLALLADGALDVAVRFEPDVTLPDLPRLGVTALVPAGFERLSWYGRGPHESYVDRRAGAAVGRWESTVDDQYVPYVLPQEHGNHTDVRWLALRRADGVGLLVSADEPVQAKASHYSDATLGTARHTVDLVRDERVHLSVDVAQRGLGGASCGPDTLERYRVPSDRAYAYSFRLLPLAAGDDPGRRHRDRR